MKIYSATAEFRDISRFFRKSLKIIQNIKKSFKRNKFLNQNPNFFVVFNVNVGALLLHENVIVKPENFTFFAAKLSKNFLLLVYNPKNNRNFE